MIRLTCIAAVAAMSIGSSADANDQTSNGASRHFDDQLTMDVTVVPPGMGALFIPALTSSNLEPAVIVMDGTKKVTVGLVGRRIVLPPGLYTLEIAQGEEGVRPQSGTVAVVSGRTTIVEPFYAALQVDAVDRRGRVKPTKYSLQGLSASADKAVPSFVGATDQRPASLSKAWLVPAGRYRVALGSDPTSADRSVAVSVHRGEVLRYRLVTDDNTIVRTELADTAPIVTRSPWKTRGRIGADVGFNSSRNDVAAFNGTALQVGGTIDLDVAYDRHNHLARFELRGSEAWLGVNNQVGLGLPLQKLTDRADASISYDYRLWRFIGPYIRGRARTSFFDTNFYAPGRTTVVEPAANGTTTSRTVEAQDKYRLLKGFAPLVFQEGFGLSATLVDTQFVTLMARAGPALRQSFWQGGAYVQSTSGDTVTVANIENYSGYGGELSVGVQLRLDEALWVESVLEGYADEAMLFGQDSFDPVYRWNNRVTLSFNRSVSVVYDFAVEQAEFGVDVIGVTHLLSARAHLSLF